MAKTFQEMIAEALGVPVSELDGRDSSKRGAAQDAAFSLWPQLQSQIAKGTLDSESLIGLLTEGGITMSPGDARGAARRNLESSLAATLGKAFGLEDIENQRFRESRDFLKGEFAKMTGGFDERNKRLDRLLFAGAADRFGAEASAGLSNLRTGLGARGINPNSGAAAALAGNIGLRQQGQLAGAKRDITIDSLRRRDAQAMDRFRSAFGLGEFMNQGDSEIGLAALGSLTSARFQQAGNEEQIALQNKNAKRASDNAKLGAVGSFAGIFA